MQKNQVHIDLETMDTRATAQILSIGAVCGGSEIYREVDQSLYLDDMLFSTSKSTREWWEQQGGYEPSATPVSPHAAVVDLALWMSHATQGLDPSTVEVWANSPGFDCAILTHHFNVFAMTTPWMFYQERDVRTIKSLSRQLKLGVREYKNPHNALVDAKNQQAMVNSVYETLIDVVQEHKERPLGS